MGKQVKKCRFYVDMLSYLHNVGTVPEQFYEYEAGANPEDNWNGDDDRYQQILNRSGQMTNLLYMNPYNPNHIGITYNTIGDYTIEHIGGNKDSDGNRYDFGIIPINFVAVLNHNLGLISRSTLGTMTGNGYSTPTGLIFLDRNGDKIDCAAMNLKEVLNTTVESNNNVDTTFVELSPNFNGDTIITLKDDNKAEALDIHSIKLVSRNGGNLTGATINHFTGSLVAGKYWDTPNAPDLKLTMETKFPNVKLQTTSGGKTLSNMTHHSPPQYFRKDRNGNNIYHKPFELHFGENTSLNNSEYYANPKKGQGRHGYRVWDLSFSYFNEDETFIANEDTTPVRYDLDTTNNGPEDNGLDTANLTALRSANPILFDQSFQGVINHCIMGNIPFIFQPDSTDNSQLAICRFADDSYKVEQVAPNVYSFSVQIEEVA